MYDDNHMVMDAKKAQEEPPRLRVPLFVNPPAPIWPVVLFIIYLIPPVFLLFIHDWDRFLKPILRSTQRTAWLFSGLFILLPVLSVYLLIKYAEIRSRWKNALAGTRNNIIAADLSLLLTGIYILEILSCIIWRLQ